MGFGCKGQLPGMGGVNQSENFLLNCSGWKDFFNEIIKTDKTSLQNIKITPDKIAIAPVTGAEQNIGYAKEEDFYFQEGFLIDSESRLNFQVQLDFQNDVESIRLLKS